MPTNLLYYKDINYLNFKAQVVNVIEIDGLFHIELDQTAFYPNAGGMLADQGTIDNIPVIDVIKKDDTIIHILASKPSNTMIEGKVDPTTRRSNIQTHDAQHLLSAILEKDYQLETISHHVHDNYCDLVLRGNLLDERIMNEVENKANEFIFNQTPLDLMLIAKADLAKYNLSDNPKYSDPVRITNIQGLDDYNACGCLHFDNLSKIQQVKCLGIEKVKNDYKLLFTAGISLNNYLAQYHEIISELKYLLKANETLIIEKTNKILENNFELNQQLNLAKSQLATLKLHEKASESNVIVIDDVTNILDARIIAQEVINFTQPIITYIQIKNNDNYQFILCKQKDSDYDLVSIFQELKNKYQLSGGGKGLSINGQSPIDLTTIIIDELN